MTHSSSKVTPLYAVTKTIRYFSKVLRVIDLQVFFDQGISPFVDLHSVVALPPDDSLVLVITSQTSSQAHAERKNER
jgi:hypothetical protein